MFPRPDAGCMGADVNIKRKEGEKALVEARVKRHRQIVEFLKATGAKYSIS
jgi:hypothetical protein